MKNNSQDYKELEDFIIEFSFDTINLQKEGTIKDYNITYNDDDETDLISILKEKDIFFPKYSYYFYLN